MQLQQRRRLREDWAAQRRVADEDRQLQQWSDGILTDTQTLVGKVDAAEVAEGEEGQLGPWASTDDGPEQLAHDDWSTVSYSANAGPPEWVQANGPQTKPYLRQPPLHVVRGWPKSNAPPSITAPRKR